MRRTSSRQYRLTALISRYSASSSSRPVRLALRASMRAQPTPIKAFTCGFHEFSGYREPNQVRSSPEPARHVLAERGCSSMNSTLQRSAVILYTHHPRYLPQQSLQPLSFRGMRMSSPRIQPQHAPPCQVPFHIRRIPNGLPSCSAGRSALCGSPWYATGRANRKIA